MSRLTARFARFLNLFRNKFRSAEL